MRCAPGVALAALPNPLMQLTNAGCALLRPRQPADGGLRNVGFHWSFAAD